MKNIIVIGDIHGRNCWKQIVNDNPDSIYIFMGDYFDSFDIQPFEQLSNFKEIIDFKKSNPDNVILLLGNHDLHYYIKVKANGGYAGYNGITQMMIDQEREYNLYKLVQNETIIAAHEVQNMLFTHAGVSSIWLNDIFGNTDNVVQNLNTILIEDPKLYAFKKGIRNCEEGNDITQGPMWIRPEALSYCRTNHTQIIGHTHMPDLYIKDNIINVDTLEVNMYLKIHYDDAMDRYYKFEKLTF